MKCTDCQQTLKPVVALDIDGTLADYHRHFFNFAQQWLGWSQETRMVWDRYPGTPSLSEFMEIDKRTYREIKLAYRQGGMKRSMPVYADAQLLTHNLRAAGAEIWVTTTRPYLRLDNIDPDTREWLGRNGISYDHLLYDEDKYTRLAQLVNPDRVVAVLDDQWQQVAMAGALFPGCDFLRKTQYTRAFHHEREIGSLAQATMLFPQMVQHWKDTHAQGH